MQRIDVAATHEYQGYRIRPGKPYPFGASLVPGGVNFSVFSRHANYCVLVLFEKGAREPMVEIPFRGMFQKAFSGDAVWGEFRIGNVFTMTVLDLDHESIEYGFRMDSGFPKAIAGQPAFHRFDPSVVLMDPYACAIGGRDVWGDQPDRNDPFQHRSRVVFDDFDWEGDRPLEIPLEDLVIYEMHVRGFTRHRCSGIDENEAGTYSGLRQRIPYLKALGINCVELMPIYEFDEFEARRWDEKGQRWSPANYWGYSTVGFFSPKAGFAATSRMHDGTMVADELKHLVNELHKNGIEVILDVVFNHTAEGSERGPTISFRGIDNATYYMLTPNGDYFNFSGTGNTLNCNNPIVRDMVIDALRYWASQYHIDGFRFDLASILGRDPFGGPLKNPPLLEALAFDPILGKCKLIAEAWDAGGLYQVGSFPAYGRWAEWNGQYRDALRRFLKGDEGQVRAMIQAVQGSPNLYQGRGPTASVNFVTCHDGFCLADLVSYNEKHNEANEEDNRDGANDNNSWNCGSEGTTTDESILALRARQMKNAVAMLMTSQGVPMILMGDEVGQSKGGNNNTYCLDDETNWLDWSLARRNAEHHRFVRNMIAFRRAHPALRGRDHLRNADYVGSGYADISWHGTRAWQPDPSGRVLAFMLDGHHAKGGTASDDFIYVAMNMYWETLSFELPQLPGDTRWRVFANTGMPAPEDAFEVGKEPEVSNPGSFLIGGRSVVILVGRSST
jgi:glycogen operon protein